LSTPEKSWVGLSEVPGGSVTGCLQLARQAGTIARIIGRTPSGDGSVKWNAVFDSKAPADESLFVSFRCSVEMVTSMLPEVDVLSNDAGFPYVAARSFDHLVELICDVTESGDLDLSSSAFKVAFLQREGDGFSEVETHASNRAKPSSPRTKTPTVDRRGSKTQESGLNSTDRKALQEQNAQLVKASYEAIQRHRVSYSNADNRYDEAVRDAAAAENQVQIEIARRSQQLDQQVSAVRVNLAKSPLWDANSNYESQYSPEQVNDLMDTDDTPAEIISDCMEFADQIIATMRRKKFGLKSLAMEAATLIQTARTAADRWRAQAKAGHERDLKAASSGRLAARGASDTRLEEDLVSVVIGITDFERKLSAVSPAWEGADWSTWTASTELPYAVRLGKVRFTHLDRSVSLPASVALPGGKPLLMLFGQRRAQAVASLHSILLRLIASFPSGKVQFTFVDPVGLGQTVAPFLHLSDYDERLVGLKVWSETKDIEARLADLTAHIELVIQKYLRSQYPSIEAHNEEAGEVAEAYRFLVVADFPTNFNDSATKRLVSLAENGPRCGVYPIILVDGSKPLPYGFDLNELYRACTVISASDHGFLLHLPDYQEGVLELESPPSLAFSNEPGSPSLFSRVLGGVGEAHRESNVVEVSQERIFSLVAAARRIGVQLDIPKTSEEVVLDDPTTWWKGSAAAGISAPIGRSGAKKVQCLSLGAGVAQHVLVAGKTGSGKSTLFHALITNLSIIYPPNELQLYLVDLKQGVGFKSYADFKLPNARVVAINSEREFALSVLQSLDSEMKTRGELFRSVSSGGVQSLEGYRLSSGKPLPRLLLLIDEFHEIFSQEDNLAAEAARLLERVLKQGRAFGIHAVLGSQTLSGLHGGVTRSMSQIGVRIALPCDEGDSRLILAEDNPAARLLSRAGEAIYNADNGRPESNQRFQVVWLNDDEKEKSLRSIRRIAEEKGRPLQPIVFEGSEAADPTSNRNLVDALSGRAVAHDLRVWLGDPIAIADPVSVAFNRNSAANLLVIGREETTAQALLTGMTCVLAANDLVESVEVIDLSAFETDFSQRLSSLASALPKIRAYRRRQLANTLQRLADEVTRRLDQSAGKAIFLIFHGLGQARDIDKDAYEGAGGEMHAYLSSILRDGPEVGIHTIAWVDSLGNLERRVRDPLREFGLRIAMPLSRDDSLRLIESASASSLKDCQAILYDEDRGSLTKFRCYDRMEPTWVSRIIANSSRHA
jgi:S-DNA-T family DNA segregation ATPase FtsK/SpoIIIE